MSGRDASRAEVRGRLVEALRLSLVGPGAGHAFGGERLPRREPPSNWYLTGFLIPSGTAPEKSADADEDDDFEQFSETGGLVEESIEERKAAQKGHFPSSMGLSFLVPVDAESLQVRVRWGDYVTAEIQAEDGKPLPVWQRNAREESVPVRLTASQAGTTCAVPHSGGLELHMVERTVVAAAPSRKGRRARAASPATHQRMDPSRQQRSRASSTRSRPATQGRRMPR